MTSEHIYLDNAATTFPKPEIVYQTMDHVNRTLAVNAGRGSYAAARQAGALIADTKQALLELVNAQQTAEVALSASATIVCNQVIGGMDWKERDCVYVTPFEHNAVMRPLYLQRQRYGFEIAELPLKEDSFELDLEKTDFMFAGKPPKAVFASHISNVLGYLLPVRELFEKTKEYGGITVLDASQSIGLAELDMMRQPVDYLIFAGHKNLYGPLGIGGCFIRNGNRLSTYLAGGTGTDSLHPMMPSGAAGLEFSSPNITAAAGLQAAIQAAGKAERKQYLKQEKQMTAEIAAALKDIPGVKLYLPEPDSHIGIIACNMKGYAAADLGQLLDEEYHIAVRTGYHCAPLVHRHLRSEMHQGIVRISIGRFTTKEEIQKFTAAIRAIAD